MIGNLLKVGLLSALSMNAPTIKADNQQTITSTETIYASGSDIDDQYMDPTWNDMEWFYYVNIDDEPTNVSAFSYTAVSKQQKLQNGTIDRLILTYNNAPQMFSYLLIKLQPNITQIDYSYFTDFRVTMAGEYDQDTNYYIQGHIMASYDITWEQNFNLVGMQDRQIVYNEYKTMSYSSLAWEYYTDKIEFSNLDAEVFYDLFIGKRCNFIANPTIPLYICCAFWVEEDGNDSETAIYDDQWLVLDGIDLTMQGRTGTYIVQEVVDIPGLCFTILTMPFSFISTAFNITLFPGTQYQVNISLLFLAIFAILVFVFLIKKFTGK